MPGDDGCSGVDGVVVGGVDAVLVPVLDHNGRGRPAGPAGMPLREVLLEGQSLNPLKFGHKLT